MAEADEPTPRTVRRARYRTVLRVVREQRPPDDRPPLGPPVAQVTQIAEKSKPFAEAERGQSRSVLQAAQDRGDVLILPAVDGRPCAVRTTAEGLEHALAVETDHERPRQRVVAAVNRARADDDLPQTPPEVLRRGD